MTGTDLAHVDEELSTGLEDLAPEDLQTPRLRIKHKEGVFVDSLSLQEVATVYAVLLGIVKQRVLWHATVEEGDAPLCKSPDFQIGFPNLEPADKKRGFPWDRSSYAEGSFMGTAGEDEDARPYLACGSCKLKEWGSHPLGDKPYCNEQWTMPLLYAQSLEDLKAGEGQLAMFTVQRSSIKPARAFATGFARSKTPMYSVYARIGLTQATKGSNIYSIPEFRQIEKTPTDMWPEFSGHYRGMRAFLVSNIPTADDPAEATPAKPKDVVDSTATEDPWAGGVTSPPVGVDRGDLPF